MRRKGGLHACICCLRPCLRSCASSRSRCFFHSVKSLWFCSICRASDTFCCLMLRMSACRRSHFSSDLACRRSMCAMRRSFSRTWHNASHSALIGPSTYEPSMQDHQYWRNSACLQTSQLSRAEALGLRTWHRIRHRRPPGVGKTVPRLSCVLAKPDKGVGLEYRGYGSSLPPAALHP